MPERKYVHVANVKQLEPRWGTRYPAPYGERCRERAKTALGDAVGLSQFGVNLLLLKPGAWSSLRHWHVNEDELIYVLEGEVVLVTDEGETGLGPGDVAGFPAGDGNGHHLINRSDRPVKVLEVGTRSQSETAYYADEDLMVERNGKEFNFMRKNGEPV